MVYGGIPDGCVVDHINGNCTDNRFENLRCISQIDNMRNLQKREPVGVKFGVTRHIIKRRDGSIDTYWRARWKELDGREGGKLFNIKKYGEDGAKALAEDCRVKAIERLIVEGARYTEVHK